MEKKRIGKIVGMSVMCMLFVLINGARVKAAGETRESEIMTSGDYQYTVLDDGTLSIVKYTGGSSTVWIPEWIDGKKVTVIGTLAFTDNLAINSVYFPDSIERVLTAAFCDCSNLNYVSLNEGLKYLGNDSFSNCNLYNLTVPSTLLEIGEFGFSDNDNLKSVEIQDGVKEIFRTMFYWCRGLEYIKLGKSIESIKTGSMDTCKSFKGFITEEIPRCSDEYLVIPSQITKLDYKNFNNCNQINKIVILNSNTSLGFECVPVDAIIYGYRNSVAERYANIYEQEFREFIQTNQITLNRTEVSLKLGEMESSKLSVNYTPDNTTIKEVAWYSSNPNVATVDDSGNVKAISNGTAVISARTLDESNLKQECKVTVTTSLKDISLDKKELYLDLSNNKSAYLNVTPQPSQASVGNITWKSSNTKVATVSSNGKITAKGAGKTNITASVDGKSKICTIYVAPKQVENLKVSNAKTDSLTLSWSKSKDASGYKVYVYSEKSKSYICITNCTSKTTSYTVKKVDGKKVTSAKKYKFKVCPYIKLDSKTLKGSYSYIKGYTLPKQTKIATIVRKDKGKSIAITWNRKSNAAYYEVWISKSKSKGFKCVKQSKGTSYTVKGLSKNQTYYVKVRVVAHINGKKVKSEYSEVKRK